MRALVVIPARFGSTRLPGKALADINGLPMIAHVVHAALRSTEVERVYVATDHAGIARASEAAGATAVMTDPTLPSGTDRVAAAVRQLHDDAQIIVNVQGDEPLLPSEAISQVVRALRLEPSVDMATLGSPLAYADLIDQNRVKVVVSAEQRALYFSRAPIGIPRAMLERTLLCAAPGASDLLPGADSASAMRHVGIYGFRRDSLFKFVALPPSPLELAEGLEQLRALEAGMTIAVVRTGHALHCGVDTPSDLEAVRTIFRHGARGRAPTVSSKRGEGNGGGGKCSPT